MKKTTAALVAALALATANAQRTGDVSFDAQLRTRGEYRNGALTQRYEGTPPAMFVNERARLSMQIERERLTLRVSAQHTGVWGQDAQVEKKGRVALNEAWANLDMGHGFFAKIGRQQLAYDDERLLGSLDWNVAGRWHDALKVGYAGGHHQVHAVLAFNQDDEHTTSTHYDDGAQPYKSMQTLWYHYHAPRGIIGFLPKSQIDVSLLAMNLGFENGTVRHGKSCYMQTVGTTATLKDERWHAAMSFYHQRGTNAVQRKVAAWMGSLSAGWQPSDQMALSVGMDHMGGNSGLKGKTHAFNPLYGTHHKFYGAMDYFYATTLPACGLQDAYASVVSKHLKRVSVQATYHYFTTGAKLDGSYRSLGQEIDCQLTCRLMPDVELTGGYSFMLGTNTMDALKGGDHTRWHDWAWLSLNVSLRGVK